MLRPRKKLFFFIFFVILVLVILIFALYPSIYRNHIRKVLDTYDQVRIGMLESEVIRLLGRPRAQGRIRTSELGQEILTWYITIEMINEIKNKYIWLLKYSYWIPGVGIDVYISEEDNTVVLIRRISRLVN